MHIYSGAQKNMLCLKCLKTNVTRSRAEHTVPQIKVQSISSLQNSTISLAVKETNTHKET